MIRSVINKGLSKVGLQITRSNGIPATYKFLNTFNYIQHVISKARDVEGDIVECGVGFGHSLMCLYYSNYKTQKRRIWAFDSFEGFPEPTSEDQSVRNPKKGEWKVITPDDLNDIFFRRCGMPNFEEQGKFKVVKGFFDQTLPQSQIGSIAILHLDVDLYSSYKTCLENLYSKVAKGGLILFDEYKQKDTQKVFPGAAKAIDEFFTDKPEKIQYNEEFDKFFAVKV